MRNKKSIEYINVPISFIGETPSVLNAFFTLKTYYSGKFRADKDTISFIADKIKKSNRTVFTAISKMESLGWIGKNKKSNVWFIRSIDSIVGNKNRVKSTQIYNDDLTRVSEMLFAATIKHKVRSRKYLSRLKKRMPNQDEHFADNQLALSFIAKDTKMSTSKASRLVKNSIYITAQKCYTFIEINTVDLKSFYRARSMGEVYFKVVWNKGGKSKIRIPKPMRYTFGYSVCVSSRQKTF